jgi:flagellin
MDLTLSGSLGRVVTTNDQAQFDLSSETAATQLAVKLIADATSELVYDTATNTLSVSTATSIDFGDLEFSSLQFTDAAGAASQIQFNKDTEAVNFSVSNNVTDTSLPLFGQVNITSGTSTGGYLLSDIKELAADGLTSAKANDFMATVDEALSQMNANRSDFGSTQNQLESSIRNMQTTQTNLKNAESVIRDVDYAAESANFNKQNIIAQAGTYAMSQANAMAQNVQRLLQ